MAFKAAGLTGHLPCVPPITSVVSGVYLSGAVLMGQGFMVSTVSRYVFLHPQPDTGTVATPNDVGAAAPPLRSGHVVSPRAGAHQASSGYLAAFAR